jgi:type IV pilus assembly protein PilB
MAEVARSRIGVATYLAPGGSLNDTEAVGQLRGLLEECRAAHELHVVLDFGQVALLNSAALELLLDTQDQLTRLGGELKVVNANGAATDAMRVTGVSTYVTLVDEPTDGESSVIPTGPRQVPRGKLGELLQASGLVSEEAVSRAIEEQAKTGGRLGQVLMDQGALVEADLLKVLSEQFAVAFVRLRSGVFDPETVRLISKETAMRLGVTPLFRVRNTLYLATPDPQSIPSFDTVAELTGTKVTPVLACKVEILETLKEAYDDDSSLSEYIGTLDLESELEIVEHQTPDDYTTIDEIAAGSPVINLINGLIQRAVRDGASDIHIEPSRTQSRIRFRIDGVLYQVMSPPLEVHPALVSRLKVMANLDIAERRLPQDGRVQVYTGGRTIDLRFSSLPGIFGEKVVLRVLDKNQSIMDLNKLGMSEDNLDTFKSLLERSYGLLLATGPTGSGKTTTLYAALSHLNSVEKSIVTIEDPVEYQIDIINQNQVKEKVGLSFAKVLKHVLRQDPDIVMVGEIREKETAEIAVQAALTGHLVLSTLHTNDSAGAITRMLDMGIEPYLLSSALIGVIAQRLVRTICPSCATSFMAPPGSLSRFGIPDKKKVRLSRGRGCSACYDSGYKGRVPIHELLVCDSDTQQLMISNPTRDALAEHIKARGVKTLLDSGLAQALDAKTTIEEVTRVVNA